MFADVASQQQWVKSIHTYQKQKRTKRPFGKIQTVPQFITHKEKKLDQIQFNPVVGQFIDKQKEQKFNLMQVLRAEKAQKNYEKNTTKYNKDYDIVNNFPPAQKVQAPFRKEYQFAKRRNFNIVSNQPVGQGHCDPNFINDRHNVPSNRDFNIISNIYFNRNQQRKQEQFNQLNNKALDTYWKTHDFNPVITTFYDQNKQEEFQAERRQKQCQHGSKYFDRFPPSYLQRQQIIIDPTKEIPQQVKLLDLKKRNAKKRFQTKYIMQQQYGQKNITDMQKQKTIIKNRLHPKKIEEEEMKLFNIINLDRIDHTRLTQLKDFPKSTWDKVKMTRLGQGSSQYESKSVVSRSSKKSDGLPKLKSGGFQDI